MLTTKEIRKMIEQGKEYLVPTEDLKIYYENEQARKDYQKTGYRNLYNAICYGAVHDYAIARRYVDIHGNGVNAAKDKELKETEAFFDSEFFKGVSKTGGKKQVIQAIEKQMNRSNSMLAADKEE